MPCLPLPWSGDGISESSGAGLRNEKREASLCQLVPAQDPPCGCGPWAFRIGTLDFSAKHTWFSIKHIEALAKLLHGTCGVYQMRGIPEEPPWGAPEESAQPWALRSPLKTPEDPNSLPAPPSHCMSHPNEPPRKIIPRKPASLGPVGPGSGPQTDHPVLTSHSPSTFGTVTHHHVLTSPERFTVHHGGLSAPRHPLH